MMLFQFEGMAGQWLSQNDWRNMRQWLGQHPEIDNWIENPSQPGSLTSALGLYRANMGPERLIAPPMDLSPFRFR